MHLSLSVFLCGTGKKNSMEEGKRDEKQEKRHGKSKDSPAKSLLPSGDVSFLLPLLSCPIGFDGEPSSSCSSDDDSQAESSCFHLPSTPPVSPTSVPADPRTPPLLASALCLPPCNTSSEGV